jgi:hypothetical protein
VEIFVLDAVLVAAAVVATRWAIRNPLRFAPLVLGLVSAAAFLIVRDRYDLEDSDFILALTVFCGIAAGISAAAGVALRQGFRRSAAFGALALCLVPALFASSIVVRYTQCLVTHCDHS